MSTLSPYIKEKSSLEFSIRSQSTIFQEELAITVADMDTRRTLIWVAFFAILVSMLAEVTFVQGAGNGYRGYGNGNHNNGDGNGGKDNDNHDGRGIDHNDRDGNGYGGGHGGHGDSHNNHNGHNNNDNNRGGYGGYGNGHNNNGNNRGGYGGYSNGHNNDNGHNNRGSYGGHGNGHNNNGSNRGGYGGSGKDNHNHGARGGDNDEDNQDSGRGVHSGGSHSTGNGNDKGGNGNQNNGNGSGKGNNGDKNGKGNGKGGNNNSTGNGSGTTDATNYLLLTPVPWTGQEQVLCEAKGACYHKTLVCPNECAQRKPKNGKNKGCYVDCSSKCEVTCKHRRPNCNGFGSLCYDPRFVGGDGVMFYFHGAKGGDFAIVSDDEFQINAHFIGTRPQGRTRDFTWVQALAVMFDTHTLVIAADRVPTWDDSRDALIVRWNGQVVSIPVDSEAEWRPNDCGREVVVERTDDANSVRVTVTGILEMDVKVRPIGAEENRVHNYQIPAGDAFAHLETQFRFSNLTEHVEGVLGKTYQPDYISPVKIGVPMPMMGGEDKYQAPSMYSPFCKVCRFQRQSGMAAVEGLSEY